MADWSKLPNDVIAHIANRIKVIEDFIAFGAVCTSWRIAATKDNFDMLSPQVQFVKSTPIHAFKFKVSELDIIKGELKDEMKTLGNSSMFVGRNWACCIDSSKFTEIKPNHIYFADKWFRCSSNFDMGAYNLEDGKIESFYPGPSPTSICPPAWVMPSLIK